MRHLVPKSGIKQGYHKGKQNGNGHNILGHWNGVWDWQPRDVREIRHACAHCRHLFLPGTLPPDLNIGFREFEWVKAPKSSQCPAPAQYSSQYLRTASYVSTGASETSESLKRHRSRASQIITHIQNIWEYFWWLYDIRSSGVLKSQDTTFSYPI